MRPEQIYRNDGIGNLPIQLAEVFLNSRNTKVLAVWYACKYIGSGKFVWEKHGKWLCERLDIHPKTAKKYLKKLLDMNMATLNEKTGMYFIHGLVRVCETFGVTAVTGYQLKDEDLRDLTTVCFSLVGGYTTIKKRRKKAEADKKDGLQPEFLRAERSKKLPRAYEPILGYETCPINARSVSVLSRVSGYSPTQTVRMKKKAVAGGYLEFTHRYQVVDPLPDSDDQVGIAEIPETKKRLVFHKGEQCFQLTDMMVSNMKLSTSTLLAWSQFHKKYPGRRKNR